MIIRKEPIQEPVNPRKRAKKDTITDVEQASPKETPPSFCHKAYYKGDNNVDKSGSTTGTNLSNISTRIEKPI